MTSQLAIHLCHVITERNSIRAQLFSALQSLTLRMTYMTYYRHSEMTQRKNECICSASRAI